LKKKERKALHKLLEKIRPFERGDEVEFLEDMAFWNNLGEKRIVKNGTKAYVFSKTEDALILHIYEKRYRGLSFEVTKKNWDKLLLIRGG